MPTGRAPRGTSHRYLRRHRRIQLPLLRGDGACSISPAEIFSSTVHGAFFLIFQKEWGVHLPPASLPASGDDTPHSGTETVQKNMLPSRCIGTRAVFRFVVPPKFKTGQSCLLWPPESRGGCRGRFRPRSAAVLRLVRSGRFQRRVPLCGPEGQSTAAASQRDVLAYCIRCGGKCQAIGPLEGFIMQRQSRSPRARPSTSISAVAMLLAKGMLFWSHRREI